MSDREINLNECPEKLQVAVAKYMERYPNVKILSTQKWVSTPYIDKSIISTRYLTFTEHGNYFNVYKMTVCTNPDWSSEDVEVSGMIAGEIAEIVRLSSVWFKY